MAQTAYYAKALTGGGTTALDYINGSGLVDGDFAFVFVSNILYHYILDDDSGAAESSPDVIAPDTNPGNKRWILQKAMADTVNDLTPQLGGNLDLNQFNLDVDPTPSADHSWSGITFTATAGENLAIGDVCYFKNDGKFWLADADAEATTKGLMAMATATIAGDATGKFLKQGFIRDDTWNWTVAAELYVHTTGGNPTSTKPSGSTDVVRIVGYAYSADVMYFDPDNSYVEIT